MRILITNDDGIQSEGIYALARRLSDIYEVIVVAPDTERSGAAHSITLTAPLRVRKASMPGIPNVEAYKVNGTPADCVIIACRALDIKPDLILSGINHGYNLGVDVHCSGTVNAAMEGAVQGIPAMAVSMKGLTSTDFSAPAQIAEELIPEFMRSGCMLFNVNVPDLPYGELKGIKYTRMSDRAYCAPFERRTDPRNVDYYWWPSRVEYDGCANEDNDEYWTDNGYVSVTPIMTNSTNEEALCRLKDRQAAKEE